MYRCALPVSVLLSAILVACGGGPPRPTHAPSKTPGHTQVILLSTIGEAHKTSKMFSLSDMAYLMKRLKPDVVCVDLPPKVLQRLKQWPPQKGEAIYQMVAAHPEVTEVILPLSKKLGYKVEGCSGTTQQREMQIAALYRRLTSDPTMTAKYQEYNQKLVHIRQEVGQGEPNPFGFNYKPYVEGRGRELFMFINYFDSLLPDGGKRQLLNDHLGHIYYVIQQYPKKRIVIAMNALDIPWFTKPLAQRAAAKEFDLLEVYDFWQPEHVYRTPKPTKK